eukprot:35399-Lingulodinium_polyedra.AAC.1
MALRRRNGESFESYIAKAQLCRQNLLTEGPEFAMGERFYAKRVLDGAEITDRDRALLLSATNNSYKEAE